MLYYFNDLTLEELLNKVYGRNGWYIIEKENAKRSVHPCLVDIYTNVHDEVVVEVKQNE